MSLFRRIIKKITGKTDAADDLLIQSKQSLNIPRHIAVIMDGNGRWAKQRNMPRAYGHRAGSKAVRKTIKASVKLGVEYLSLYTFSSDNWGRPKTEVSALMKIIEENLIEELPELHSQGIRIITLGKIEELPESTRAAFDKAVELTKDNKVLNLQVAVNYSGYNEILDAVAKLRESDDELSEESFRSFLYNPDAPYPDLLVRTGGEYRISNFLLWQVAYSELWFADLLWPDFNEEELVKAIKSYSNRERRFGKLSEES